MKHRTQLPSIEAVFGDISKRKDTPSPGFETERFVLGWQQGELYPGMREQFFTDGLT
ncbi:hypothetical protein [Xylanibacillus composti]|uniref:Uncharacterized protein n=1 Tax=Xylanibacillus composti TaxID=1572762 RepID=A0A8J4H2G7_9BACL|nr:hypothetical protein [Xylanibacillus composti]GIQ67749.1 hypothetical protein XYCOK13_05730 [Xylanibacillus composti]